MKRTTLLTGLFITILFSCTEDTTEPKLNTPLIGSWVDTVYSSPNGYYINELAFKDNALFTEKSSAYGTYEGQDNNELSGWFTRTGNYVLGGNRITFLAEKVVSWDSFFGGVPVTNIETHMIFENCTFTADKNMLELNYTTYPLEAPENTKRQYEKQNNQ